MTVTASGSRLAVDGGDKVRDRSWPSWPVWGEEEERALIDALHSGQWWSIGGTKVPEFEAAFARFQQANYCTGVTNGTHALEICLRALGIGCGDEVIVPPYSFIATASCVLAVSATPVFADIEPKTLNLDPARVEEAISPRTKALIAVHIAGCPADMEGLLAIAKRHGLAVIEDAAQAVGAEWDGKRVGALGDCGTFSFQASKNLNCGEGGAIVCNDGALADKLWSVHNVGRTRAGKWYEHHVLGGNFRMTEWQAAILLAQLGRVDDQARRRTDNAQYLNRLLGGIPGVAPLETDRRITQHAYHLYVFRYDPRAFGGRSRAEFLRALNAEGIPAASGYVPLYKEVVFQRKSASQGSWCQSGRAIDFARYAERCPVCEAVCEDAVWLFQSMLLAERRDMDDIAEAVEKVRRAWSS